MHVAQRESFTWTEIDEALTRLAGSKGLLDLEIGRWLVAAQDEGVWSKLGLGSFVEYVERRLGFDARTTYERVRVARALESLPGLTTALRTGERSWSAVRELTRVATPKNEAAWIAASERKTVRQIEAEVAGREPGDDPGTAPAPLLRPQRLVFELPPDELAEWVEAAEAMRREIGPAASNREVLRAMAQTILGQRPAAQPGYQTVVTLCAGCERTWQRAGGELVEVAPEVGDCARCDSKVIGVVEIEGEHEGGASAHMGTREHGLAAAYRDHGHDSATGHVATREDALSSTPAACDHHDSATAHVSTPDHSTAPALRDHHSATAHVGTRGPASATTPDEATLADLLRRLVRTRGTRVLTRLLASVVGVPPRTLTPRLRAAVHARDGGRCVVPGCRNFRFVDLHHVQHRAHGGAHTVENVFTLCTRHHRMIHEGVLHLERAGDGGGVVVRHAGGTLYGARPVVRAVVRAG